MTTHRYILLFSVRINHTYYKDGICRDLEYTPSSATQKLIDTYELYFKKTSLGFSFYYASEQSVTDFLNDIKTIDAATSFSFDVISTDQNFTLFTDYPITTIGVFSFDTMHVPITDSSTVLKGVFIPSNESRVSFVITIGFDAIIRFRESGNSPTYTIQFASRKTQWRYYIINTSDQGFEKFEIQTNSNIQFEDPIEVTLPNGASALLFSSGHLKIPLQESPTHSFDLVATKTNLGNTHTQVIVKGLPMAGSNHIETYTEDDTIYVASPLYIYI